MRAAAFALFGAGALTLHGCGGGGGGDAPATTPAPTPAPPPAPPPPADAPGTLPETFAPIRGVLYDAPPNVEKIEGDQPARDFMQKNYEPQWGAAGRDDLGTMKEMGATAVRLSRSIGLESQQDHKAFLDRAKVVGLDVITGYHTQMICDNFDCMQSWKDATMTAFKTGHAEGSSWHSTIKMLVLQDQPDTLNFQGSTIDDCSETPNNKCWCRAVLSAVDGVLQAEKELGVPAANRPNMSVSWSSAARDSIDGELEAAIGYYGFYDMKIGFNDPAQCGYQTVTPLREMQVAFAERWTHGLNTGAPWTFISGKIDPIYDQYFAPTPWWIPAWDINSFTGDAVASDLQAMETAIQSTSYMGVSIMQFQRSYAQDGRENGLFDLSKDEKLNIAGEAVTGSVCEEDVRTHSPICGTFPIHCLVATDEGKAAAKAWGGTTETSRGTCQPPQTPTEVVV